MAGHDFNFVCILLIVCILNIVLNVSGDAELCVEPPFGHKYSPPSFNESPNEPFYEGPNVQPHVIPDPSKYPKEPFYEGPGIIQPHVISDPPKYPKEPFYEGPGIIQPHVIPDPPKYPKEPFYEGPGIIQPIVVPDPPIEEGPKPPCKGENPINVKYETKSPGGELGIKFSYDTGLDKLMNVMISYDTESAPAVTFFKQQFTSCLFQRFTQCGVIKWDIVPCSKSKMKGGELWCPNSNQNCQFDKIHACIATIYKADQLKVGMFVICFFTQGNNAQECATKSGLNYDIVWKCASGDEGATDCDECYRHIYDIKPPRKYHYLDPMTPGISDPVDEGGIKLHSSDPIDDQSVVTSGKPNPVGNHQLQERTANPYAVKKLHGNINNPTSANGSSKDSNLNAIADFKGAVCAKLVEGKLKCDFCSL